MSRLRSVAGRTDRVVVVGAGLAGLAAALHLIGAGRDVTVVERADHPGGRMGRYRLAGRDGSDYAIDNGATVLTMPGLIDEALAAVGSDRAAVGLQIVPLAPSYHGRFADHSTIDVYADPDRMAAEVARTCGPDDERGYRRLRAWLATVFETEYGPFLDANFDNPLDMLADPAALARLVRHGGFGRLGHQVDRRIADPRLRRLFTFQALYAGVAPDRALAIYAAIAHMDTSLGVFYPIGGMHAVPAALAAAVTAAGGQVVLNTEVTGIDYAGRRARAVRTTAGVLDCDAVVLTADLGSADRFGVRIRRPLRAAPSAVVLHGTIPTAVTRHWAAQAHHTIDFGAAWQTTFAEITARHGRVMADPSLLLTRPALTDPGQLQQHADGDREPLSVLAPCPNLKSAPLDWDRFGPTYQTELLDTLEARGYPGVAAGFAVDHLDTPATWHAQGMVAGTPFALAHVFRQTGPFRPRNLVRGRDNLVLAGCGTTPGVGVPTVLLSGKLAAARITGEHSTRSTGDPVGTH
ncbi:phytoene desaturase family protein [Skermania piniformis]|uniref:Phytoene desaturase n=1 Tax=Skermania pinensis TaxID=39122 RepID=A0ABX8SDP8_9ACTN|nr:phytoene desaturase family protein [Skermania piniformis]QXQ15079.1 phytoene desaturase [Skermania piniformis]